MDLVFSFQKVFKVIQIHLNPSLAELGADATLESLRNHLTDVVTGHPRPACLGLCLQIRHIWYFDFHSVSWILFDISLKIVEAFVNVDR